MRGPGREFERRIPKVASNPYQAPRSDVRDIEPQRLLAERPRQVVYATVSFWLSFLISIPQLFIESESDPAGRAAAVFAAILLGLILVFLAVANVGMWRGRNWARIVFLIFSILSVVTFVLGLGEMLQSPPIEIVPTVISTGLDVVVSYLLFTKPGSLWFRTAQQV